MVDQNNVLTAPSCQEIWREDCMQRCMQTLQQGLPREQVLKTHLQMTCLVWLRSRFHITNGTNSFQLAVCFNKKFSGRRVRVHVGPQGMPWLLGQFTEQGCVSNQEDLVGTNPYSFIWARFSHPCST